MEVSISYEIENHYDLIVCGGGMAGTAAAVSAARLGLRTAIVEQYGCLGGTATCCGINQLLGGRFYQEKERRMVRAVGGIFDELTDLLIREKHAVDPDTTDVDFNPFGWYPRMAAGISVSGEHLKYALDELCQGVGVDVLFFTVFIGPVMEQGRIKSLILHGKNGFFGLSADLYIDATGDADVAAACGCPVYHGRTEDGLTAPTTLEMTVSHVDGNALVSYQNLHQSPKLTEIIAGLKARGIWNFESDIFVAVQLLESDRFLINTLRQTGVDGTSSRSLAQAAMEGRRLNLELFSIIKEHFPGFQNARIDRIYDVPGIRETRRIDGLYTVTLQDALSGRSYEDAIASTTYNFDLPDPKNPNIDPMMGNTAHPRTLRPFRVIHLPYRSLLPKDVDNLAVCGRAISVEREVLGAARVIGPAIATGEAAGAAACFAQRLSGSFPAVPPGPLRQQLKQQGLLLQ